MHVPDREEEPLGLVDEVARIPAVHYIRENLPDKGRSTKAVLGHWRDVSSRYMRKAAE